MSYIQIEIGGKQRGLKFNKMAQLILEEKMRPNNTISGAYGLVYGGLIANCYVKQQEPDFTFEEVCDWVDGLDDEILFKIKDAFAETEAYKKGQAYLAELEETKKNGPEKDNPSSNTKENA